jgi:hypothetical protein
MANTRVNNINNIPPPQQVNSVLANLTRKALQGGQSFYKETDGSALDARMQGENLILTCKAGDVGAQAVVDPHNKLVAYRALSKSEKPSDTDRSPKSKYAKMRGTFQKEVVDNLMTQIAEASTQSTCFQKPVNNPFEAFDDNKANENENPLKSSVEGKPDKPSFTEPPNNPFKTSAGSIPPFTGLV